MKRAAEHWKGVLKMRTHCGLEKELVSKVNQRLKLNPIHTEINQVSSPRLQHDVFTMMLFY